MRTCRKIKILAFLFALMLAPVLVHANTLVVREIRSGGVIVFSDSFQPRLTGLVVPGVDHRLGLAIRNFIKESIGGQRVSVFTWTTDNTAAGIVHDEDGRPFVQIVYGTECDLKLNEILLKKGYAQVDKEFLPEDCHHFIEIEMSAQAKRLGIWAD